MSIKSRIDNVPQASRGNPESGTQRLLVAAARIAVIVGAVASAALMIRAGRNTPRLLLILFVIWVLSPFLALGWANIVSKSWPSLTRGALYWVTIAVTVGALAFYAKVISPPAGSAPAFVYVAIPPASWVLMTAVVLIAALVSRKRPS